MKTHGKLIWTAFAAAALTSCGSGERTFTAASFVDEMNARGAALDLGPVLTTNPEGIDIYTVTFSEPPANAPAEGAPPADVQGSATLIVLEDSESAADEFARCEQAPILTCFRGANAVLRVEGLEAADQTRISNALESFATPE